MSGLFDKTRALIEREPQLGAKPEPIVFDESSGISKEDQKEVLQEIEKAASRNKLAAGPQAFVLKAQKRGILMPLLVNLLGLFLLAAGGGVLYYFYQRGETTLKAEAAVITSAEGKLIEELKKESEEKLLAKNREIDQIQGRLSAIDKEREDLARNLEARVSAREQELRRGLDAALEAEREKLRRQGLSEQDIGRRLEQLETEKSTELQAQVESFRRKAEEEKAKAESNLKALEQEYQASLAQAGTERQKVLDEAQQRERELRSQLETRTQALQAESREARQELARINAQREKEQLASSQLLGFYYQIKADLQSGRLDQALSDVDGVRKYLDDPAVAALPGVRERREVEFFVLDSITSLARSEMNKEPPADTGSLIAAANLLTDLRSRVAEGDALMARGEAVQAAQEYGEALALIPEANQAHKHLLEKGTVAEGPAEQARRGRLRESLARAQSAYQARDYAGALEAYAQALAYLPEEPATIERLVSEVRQSGFELGSERQRRQDSSAAAGPLAEADRLSAQGRYTEAIPAYADLLARHPASVQARAAVLAIGRAVEALEKQAPAGQGDAALRRQLAERETEVQALKAQQAQAGQGDAALRRQLAEREAEVQALKAQQAQAERQIASLKAEASAAAARQAAAEPSAPVMDEATRQKLARLESLEAGYNQILGSYRKYADKEDSLLSAQKEEGLTPARGYLNSFLSAADSAFPGLSNRINRYDEAYLKTGRSDAMEEVKELLSDLSARPDPQERRKFLDGELARRKGDPLMVELLRELKTLQGR
jgi:hypothetical protein